jgi:hypothetical protein
MGMVMEATEGVVKERAAEESWNFSPPFTYSVILPATRAR